MKWKTYFYLVMGKWDHLSQEDGFLKSWTLIFFIIEKEASLRKIAIKDGFKTYENIENINETKNSEFFDIIFLAVKPQQMEETVRSFYNFNLHKSIFVSIAAGLSFSWFRKKINKEIENSHILDQYSNPSNPRSSIIMVPLK